MDTLFISIRKNLNRICQYHEGEGLLGGTRERDLMMGEPIEKAILLAKVQSAYEQLNTLLATLSEEQKTTLGVNGSWSLKDNLAHITAWQDLLPARIQSWIAGHSPVEFLPEFQTEDEVNEHI
jgi:hypothetical protein